MKKSNPLYLNAFGVWNVTTEGDCEGRSIHNLGTHEGYVDEIALKLASQCYYSLRFSAVDLHKQEDEAAPLCEEVSVSFDIDSGTWDKTPEARAEMVRPIFRDRPVRIKPGNYYASFIIQRGKTAEESEQEMRGLKRKAALAKLSVEERELLGLE